MGKAKVKKDAGHLGEPFSRTKLELHDQLLREHVYLGVPCLGWNTDRGRTEMDLYRPQ